MLEIRMASLDDIHILKELLKESNLKADEVENYISNCMIAYDCNTAVAAAGFIQIDDIAIITFVIVKNTRRREYLGDGIVKALLNLADKRGVTRVFVAEDHCALFFKKIGFQEMPLSESKNYFNTIRATDLFRKNKIFSATLPDFFLKACKHHH
ncbi:GNAT family N-acetyltransferase [Clostridiaceae bacterium 35-E11]